jgi:hypothetical protein
VIALQAGCRQRPEPGTLVSLNDTIFTSSPVNATEPEENILERPEGAGSNTLTTGAIVGIAVGVGLLLVGAMVLFIIYGRKKKYMEKEEKIDYHGSHSNTPDPILPPDGGHMTASLRSYSQQSHHGPGAGGRGISSGEYYDKLEEDMGGALSYNFDPRSTSRGPNSAIPSHQAYIPRAVSRLRTETDSRSQSPPAANHRYSKSIPAGSFPLQTYDTTSTPNRPPQAAQPPPSSSRRSQSVGGGIVIPPPPPMPPPPKGAPTPAISMPSLRKMRLPKKYAPPAVTSPDLPEIQISQPVIGGADDRFADAPLKGGPVVNTEFKGFSNSHEHVGEIPLRSGKSTLYG